MKLRDIRDLVFCPCEIVVDNLRMLINTHMPSKFDNYEVVGIRASSDNDEPCVVLSLKQVASDTFQGFNLDFLRSDNQSSICSCDMEESK